MAIDYFAKWVEAEPFAKITEAKITGFIWKAIIYRFDLPRVIVIEISYGLISCIISYGPTEPPKELRQGRLPLISLLELKLSSS